MAVPNAETNRSAEALTMEQWIYDTMGDTIKAYTPTYSMFDKYKKIRKGGYNLQFSFFVEDNYKFVRVKGMKPVRAREYKDWQKVDYEWADFTLPIGVSHTDKADNSGSLNKIPIDQTMIDGAMSSLYKQMVVEILGNGALSNSLSGLRKEIPDSGEGRVAGVDRSAHTLLHSQVSNKTGLTITNILDGMNDIEAGARIGKSSGRINTYLMGYQPWLQFQKAARADVEVDSQNFKSRNQDAKEQSFMGIEVTYDPQLTAFGGKHRIYGFDRNILCLNVVKGMNWSVEGPIDSAEVRGDAYRINFRGQITNRNPKANGVVVIS